jgi:outer membrane cobalamin receptor
MFYFARHIVAACLMLVGAAVAAQNRFEGKVVDQALNRLPQVNLQWLNEQEVYSTSDSGQFAIPFPQIKTDTVRLVARFESLVDTFAIDDLNALWTLKMSGQFEFREVQIMDERTGAYISSIQVYKTEIIDRGELRKAACCDLAGCFETQSTVQPQVTNVITNAKELRVLGLSGVYNQLLIDGMPAFSGLSYTYGLGHVPGSMIENIWVVKGANSVVQGHDALVGQITVWPREGGTAEALTGDVLMNSFGEKHFNAALALNGKKWTNYTAIHASLPGGRWDRDDDGYLDLPLLERYMAYSKWRYRKENENGFSAFVSLRGTSDHRVGGHTLFDEDLHKGTTMQYGQVVDIQQADLTSKMGWRWRDNHKVSLYTAAQRHVQNTSIGITKYTPNQWLGNAILQYELFYGPSLQNEVKAGFSARWIDLKEEIIFLSDTIQRTYSGKYNLIERETGAFVENTKKWKEDSWAWVVGLRTDLWNVDRVFFTPRSMLRWHPSNAWDFRISAGYGWRTVRLFAENFNVLTSNRDIVFIEAIQPEEAINTGTSVTYKQAWTNWNLTISGDAFYTTFENQFFPDYDQISTQIIIRNYDQPSVSIAVQGEVLLDWNNHWTLRTAYNYLDVYRMVNGVKKTLPYTNQHKVLTVLGYKSTNGKWRLDYNGHWYSKPSLPFVFVDEGIVAPRDFWIGSVQATYAWRDWEFFGGCENMTDFRLERPFINGQNPFGQDFDTSYIWGPTRGREFYLGLRWKLKTLKKNNE